jgi:Zn-dependent metalloprotease
MTVGRLVALLALAALAAIPAAGAQDRDPTAVAELRAASSTPVAVYRNPATGAPYFLRARIAVSKFSDATSASGRGADFWAAYGRLFGIRSAGSELALHSAKRDRYGVTHLRYDQRYRGLPVFGRQLLLHLQNGEAIAANGQFADQISVPTTPKVSEAGAAWTASRHLPVRGRRSVAGKATLLVHVSGLNRARLAWRVSVASSEPFGLWNVFVDALDGDVLRAYNDLHTARDRITYTNANDSDCNQHGAPACTLPGTELRNELGAPVGDPVADDTHANTGTVYDYYSTNFGRDSYDRLGHTLRSTVHFGVGFDNAFWCGDECASSYFGSLDGGQMVYGDGSSLFSPLGQDLDVVAHELTHAVTEDENGLLYQGQSGALNESYSDVFAAMVDTDGDEWLIGEKSWTPGTPGDALRNMANPAAEGQPGSMSEYVNTVYDGGGVHANSGIPNRAAYLAATDPGYGIGRAALQQIYYGAMPCLSTGADFLENLQCLLLAARTVFPGDDAKARAIRFSQAAVGIATKPSVTAPNGGEVLAAGTPASLTWSGATAGQPFQVTYFQSAPTTYGEGFESGPPLPAGFTTGSPPWFVGGPSPGNGTNSARSAAIPHEGRTELHLVVTVRQATNVTFNARVSSEEDYDFFSLHVDGVPELWGSGEIDWTTPPPPVPLTAGTHELVWVYEKDIDTVEGEDAAWIDNIVIPNLESSTATVINATTGADATSQSWTPPDASGSNYRIRVQRLGIAPWLASDESDNVFTVTGSGPPPPPLDTQAPTNPTVQSTSHRPGAPSRDRTVDVTWSAATDNQSGVDGFSYLWDRQATTLPDPIKELEETARGTSSPPLANGRWYFHLRTRDNAGNWSSAGHIGPFVIVSAPARCIVPNVKRKTVAQARRLLVSKRCALGRVARAYSGRVKARRIISQSRRPGARLPRGTKVKVVVSRGKRRR